jgi:hypothetical protein
MQGRTLPTAAALHTLKATAVPLQPEAGYATGGGVVVDYRCTIDGVPVRSVRKCTKVHRMAVRGKRYAFAMGTGVAAYVSISGGGHAAVGLAMATSAASVTVMLMATVTAMATVAATVAASTSPVAPVTVAVTVGAMVVATRPVADTWCTAAWAAPAASAATADHRTRSLNLAQQGRLQEKSCRRSFRLPGRRAYSVRAAALDTFRLWM